MDANDVFSRIWSAFETGRPMAACAWCGRVRINDAWVIPPTAVLAAIDARYAFSHSICEGCAEQHTPSRATLTQQRPEIVGSGSNADDQGME
jgi:hypothetical protein